MCSILLIIIVQSGLADSNVIRWTGAHVTGVFTREICKIELIDSGHSRYIRFRRFLDEEESTQLRIEERLNPHRLRLI